MAATLDQIHNARVDNSLITKTESAVLVASRDIINEDPGTADHAVRIAAANACFTNETYLQEFLHGMMYYISTNDTIASNPAGATDGDIQFVVNGNYTIVATAFPPA